MRRSVLAAVLSLAVGGAAWAGFQPAKKPLAPVVQSAPSRPTPSPAPIDSTRSHRAVPVTQPNTSPKPAKKEYALLTVASEPWGTLFVNDKEIGPTPIADYPLPVGTHRLRLEQEGYRSKHETLVVTGPNPIRRRYSLEPAGPP